MSSVTTWSLPFVQSVSMYWLPSLSMYSTSVYPLGNDPAANALDAAKAARHTIPHASFLTPFILLLLLNFEEIIWGQSPTIILMKFIIFSSHSQTVTNRFSSSK